MRERGILFSAPMVRAILEGRKTQTRRVVPRATGAFWDHPGWTPTVMRDGTILWRARAPEHAFAMPLKCPYGAPGDRLWVRETWGAVSPDEISRPLRECTIEYRADLPPGCTDRPGKWPAEHSADPECPKWRPSLHMPRWASRLTLEVTSVRVERLQDITEEGARAEGVEQFGSGDCDECSDFSCAACADTEADYPGVRGGNQLLFAELWDRINGKRAPWASNPWVWVVSFERVAAAREVA
jgi:hypothetical protein